MQVFLFSTNYTSFHLFLLYKNTVDCSWYLNICWFIKSYFLVLSYSEVLFSPSRAFILLNTEAHTTLLSLPGHFQQTRAYKTRTFTTIWKTWLSMYEASLCGPITSVDRTWLFHSVAEPALLIIHALQGSGHPHVLLTGLAPFRCYCQRKWMSNSTCFCWVLAHPHQGSGWVLLTMWLIDREE